MRHDKMVASVVTKESETHARQAWIGLVVGREHGRERLWLKHSTVLVRPAAEQGRDVACHVASRGVDTTAAAADPVAIGNGPCTAGAEGVPCRKMSLHPLGSDEVGVGHAQGLEDMLAEVAFDGPQPGWSRSAQYTTSGIPEVCVSRWRTVAGQKLALVGINL